MDLVTGNNLSGSFRKGTNEEAFRRFALQRRQQQDRERRQKEERLDQGESDLIDLASVVISSEQEEFLHSEINVYQTATVEALERNREAIEIMQERLEQIMMRAHTLEGGRRVFKTEDGLRVFDEFGAELSPDIISPDEISDHAPRWETAKDMMDELERLEAEQSQLLDFQADLDDAQDLLDSGKMTQVQFDNLRTRLAADAPDAVKSKLPQDASANETRGPSDSPAADIDLDAELAQLPTFNPVTLISPK